MTTKTIPVYLEEERQKHQDDQLRIVAEAARIQPLHHGHHRTPKQHKLELPSPEAVGNARKTASVTGRKPQAAQKKATKARKVA